MRKSKDSAASKRLASIVFLLSAILALVLCSETALSAPSTPTVTLIGGQYYLEVDGVVYKELNSSGVLKVKYFNTDHTAKKNAINKAFACNGCKVSIMQNPVRVTATWPEPEPLEPVDCPVLSDPMPSEPSPAEPLACVSDSGLEFPSSNWLYTGAGSLEEDVTTFSVQEVDGTQVLMSESSAPNVHAHLRQGTIPNIGSCEFTGRMQIASSSTAGIGVTFGSDYPNSDTYYRMRMEPSHKSFYLSPHGTEVEGDIETGVVPIPGTWVNFHVRLTNMDGETRIQAKAWMFNESEEWQIDAFDFSANRITSCNIGAWSMGAQGNMWDDLNLVVTEQSESGANGGTSPTDPAVEPEPILGSVELSWDIPTKRQDGSALTLPEIRGYNIAMSGGGIIGDGTAASGGIATIYIDDANTVNHTISGLAPGTYVFAINTVDSDGLEGPWSCDLSNPTDSGCVTTTVE